MHPRTFEKLVADGVNSLPDHIQRRMHNVVILIEKEPTSEQVRMNTSDEDGTIFGLYEGLPLTERGVEYSALPDKITIFRKPILDTYSDPEDIRACISNTVWHEVAHHFGFDDETLEKEEVKRGKTL